MQPHLVETEGGSCIFHLFSSMPVLHLGQSLMSWKLHMALKSHWYTESMQWGCCIWKACNHAWMSCCTSGLSWHGFMLFFWGASFLCDIAFVLFSHVVLLGVPLSSFLGPPFKVFGIPPSLGPVVSPRVSMWWKSSLGLLFLADVEDAFLKICGR